MDGRFEATSSHLRDVALDLLLERGARAFSLEALARRGYVSIGAVYERWRSPQQTIADIVRTRVIPALAGVADECRHGGDPFSLLLLDESGSRALRGVVEACFGARDHRELRAEAELGIEAVATVLASGTRPLDPDAIPYTTVLLVGLGLLATGGCHVAPMAEALAEMTAGRRREEPAPTTAGPITATAPEGLTPPVGVVHPADATGSALRDSTRRLLSGPDGRGPSIRSIASEAGVTTGAVYRRFDSRSTLIADVLTMELQGPRYAWMGELLEALESPEPLDGAARVMAAALNRATIDSPTNRMLLEITVNARTDEFLRNQLVSQIDAVAQSRVVLFDHLRTSGVTRPEIAPAALAWVLQAGPIGGRLMGACGVLPEEESLATGIRHLAERAMA